MKRKALKTRIAELKTVNEYNIDYALELLPSIKKAIGGKNGKVWCTVDTVSQSGMSRTINIYILHKGDIINLNNTPFWAVYGDSKSKGKVRIHGCGMDMLFEATYRLYKFLYDQKTKPYQKHLNRYNRL